MNELKLQKTKNCDNLIKQIPKKEQYKEVIREDCVFMKNGKCVGVYVKIPKENLNPLRQVVLTTKVVKNLRTNGLATQSSIFGALPRVAIRNDFCRFSATSKAETNNLNILFSFVPKLLEIYEKYLPQNLKADIEKVSVVNSDYQLTEEPSPFLTANINVNHAIRYHRDTGNFKGSLSNVLILKKGLSGGELVFPEYNMALCQDDGYLAIFDGQKEIHGVMPIKKKQGVKTHYRASIVYYTLEQMKHCYPYKEEVTRLQKVATQNAKNRLKSGRKKEANKFKRKF